mgnify:CR=1 FL=1
MNEEMKKNEELILKKIDELKECIWGLNQDIHESFYDYSSKNGYQYNEEKATVLIQSILKNCDKDKQLFYEVMPVFLELTLKFLFIACNTDDWIYSSFVKLSETVTNGGLGRQSTWDNLIGDEEENLKRVFGEVINEKCQYLSKIIASEDLSGFPMYVKEAIKKHLSDNGLNYLCSDSATGEILHALETLQNDLYWNNRFRIEARGHQK